MYQNNQVYQTNQVNQTNRLTNMYQGHNEKQQLMMMKQEQMRKIKNISDLNIPKEKITEYVINPIKIEKSSREELNKLTIDEQKTLSKKYVEEQLWKNRTNVPYKIILKNENWKKEFNKQEDLIVYKITDNDKNNKHLENEYNKLQDILNDHNGELKVMYSVSNESDHKKKFKFVKKYKSTLVEKPTQKNNNPDEILSKIIDEDATEEDVKKLEKEYINNKSNVLTIDDEINELVKIHGKNILDDLNTIDKVDKVVEPKKLIKIGKITKINS